MKHFSEISPTAERVVDAAEGLIQERGYNGFSYDDVAKLVKAALIVLAVWLQRLGRA